MVGTRLQTLLALCLAACAHALPAVDQPGAAEAYRAELQREGGGPRSRALREALEQAEFEAAKKAHDILAWRRLLSEFPGGPFTAEARARLESLRWVQAETQGTEAALAGFLADEPNGAHAAEAWKKLAALRLEAALAERSAPKLQAWLAANPAAEGQQRAQAALDEARFAVAREQGGFDGAAALRAYLVEHPDGKHRAAAQALVADADVAEAALLEDEGRLAAFARAGAPGAQAALASIRDAAAADASDPRLAAAARALWLPQPTDDELDDDATARAATLWSWAAASDGARLPRLLSEIGASRAQVGLAALRAAGALIASLPPAERTARASRLLRPLRPKAQAAPMLVQVSLLEEAAGHAADALATARAAFSRDPSSLAAGWRAAALEAGQGPAPFAVIAAQALATSAQSWAELHADAARPSAEKQPDRTALLELCAASLAAREAERLLAARRVAAEPGIAQALERARRIAERIDARVQEGERARPAVGRDCSGWRAREAAIASEAAERRRAAARALAAAPDRARPALERALRRDPDEQVRQIVRRALDSAGPRRASAAAPR